MKFGSHNDSNIFKKYKNRIGPDTHIDEMMPDMSRKSLQVLKNLVRRPLILPAGTRDGRIFDKSEKTPQMSEKPQKLAQHETPHGLK